MRSRLSLIAALGAITVTSLWIGGSPPSGAATATLRVVRVLDHTLSGNYSKTGTSEAYSSPAIGDITGDGVPELVTTTVDGTVIAYRTTDFSVLWKRSLGSVALQASPVLADMGGDSKADVIVGAMNGRVYWLDGPSGSTARTFAEGAPQFCPGGTDCRPHGFFATPTVADITGDGRPEIIAASYDHSIYAWERTGRQVFRTFLYDTLWSSPVVADIDGNGTPEIVLGGDIYPGNPLGVSQGGLVWVLNRTGSIYSGYPKSIPGQTVWSSPAVTDLNGDGGLDVVVGTGTFGDYGDTTTGRRVYAFSARTRRDLPGWPVTVDGRVTQGPAVGDIDGDGAKEVAFGSEGGYVYAYERTGARKWRACAAVGGRCANRYSTHGSAVIADIDADGRQEVIAALDKDLMVFDGASGAVEASYRLTDGGTLAPPSLPAIGENASGDVLIAMQTAYRVGGHGGGVIPGDRSRIHVVTTDQCLGDADWPKFKRDAGRTGLLKTSGRAWAPFPCVRQFVDQLYSDFLGRQFDEAGMRFWVGRINTQGWTGPRVIRSFMDSNEFGRIRSPLVRLHVGLTNLPPVDYDAFAGQARRFAAGPTIDVLAQEMAGDGSVKDASGALVAQKTNAQFVTDTYKFALARNPTATEQAYGEAALAGGTKRGEWFNDIAQSGPAVIRMVPNVYVTMSYLGMLGRVPETSGYQYWVPRVRSGVSIEELLRQFQNSSEYERRVL